MDGKGTVPIRSIRSSRVTEGLAKRNFGRRHASQSRFGGRFAPLGLQLGLKSTQKSILGLPERKTNLLLLVTRHSGWRIDRIDTVRSRTKNMRCVPVVVHLLIFLNLLTIVVIISPFPSFPPSQHQVFPSTPTPTYPSHPACGRRS